MAIKKSLEVVKLERRAVIFRIYGITPLLINAFNEEARRPMLERKEGKRASLSKKNQKAGEWSEEIEARSKLYLLDAPEGQERYGFPSEGLKACIIRGIKAVGGVMSDARGAIFVEGEFSDHSSCDGRKMIEINGSWVIDTRSVRVGNGVLDIRCRPRFDKWYADVEIDLNINVISIDVLSQALEAGGYGCGIGDFRPEKAATGDFGRFTTVKPAWFDKTFPDAPERE